VLDPAAGHDDDPPDEWLERAELVRDDQ